MSYGRNSPSTCLPHHDEYTNDTEIPRRPLLSGYFEQRPRSAHGGIPGGTVAARVRSLNAAFSSSVPSLALPKEEYKNAESELNGQVSQGGSIRSTETSLAIVQNLHPLRKKASFLARRQGTLIRTRSNPFVRRDSSAASSSPSLKVARSRSRDAPIQSPGPLRRLPLDSLKLHEDLPGVSDADLAAAAKGSARWANMLWNVWTGVKTTLPRQVFIDAVESKLRERHEVEHPRKRLGSREAGREDDSVAEIGADSHALYQSKDSPVGQSPTKGSNQMIETNIHLVQRDERPQQLFLQPYDDYEKESRYENSSAATHERLKPQLFSDNNCRDRATLPSESTMSIRSTSPWPDFDDVGYIPSETGDSATRFSQTTPPSRHVTRSYPNAPVDTVTPQPLTNQYDCRSSEPRIKSSTSSLKSGSISKSTSDGNHTHPRTAIAIRLGDMFDAVIIARGDQPLPHPEVAHFSGEDQHDCMQDLQQISAGLMQRTKELLAARPLQNAEQHDETENRTRKNRGQQSHAMYDSTQLGRGLNHCHHYQRHRHSGNCCGSGPYTPLRPFSYEDGTENESDTERKAYEKVMSVPALLRLIDSTAKDLGLVLKSDEGIAPLRPRPAQIRRGYRPPAIC